MGDQMLNDRRPAKLDHPWHKRGQNLTSVPVAIHRFYDQILSNPAKAAQNFTLLNETVKEDWTVRPNPADIVGGKGPGVVGLQRIMQLFGEIIPDLKFERKEMFIHEDKVVVLLKVSGTIEKAPEGEEFIPFFPGVAPSELVGKNFETLAVDIHSIVDGKIQQSYHTEDWRTAVYQMIKGEPVPDFGFHPEYIRFERFNLTEHTHRVPKAIANFYDKMINHLDTYGQNQTLINETFSQDFNGKKAAFLQGRRQEPAGPPPPPGFEEYKKNAASGGVTDMIQQIISDAKAMEAEAIRSEEDAQKAYEDFVKETNASIEAKSKEIVNKSELKAKAESELVETKEAKEAVMLELEQLSNYNAELHQSCDFVMKNFDVRQTARDEEVEALKQAKAILSGAKFEEFLQSA